VNAERLHAILYAIDDEVSDTTIYLTRLRDGLQQSGTEPGQTAHQEVASEARSGLEDLLSGAPSTGFSPGWREALDELGIADLLGEQLRERVESILTRNKITPSAAATALDPITQRVQELEEAIKNVQKGFRFFEIGTEQLNPGEFEIGFVIPRDAVRDELEGLGLEFVHLKRILGPFLEIATGTREEVHVRSISSSAFGAFLDSTPAAALLVATAIERLISSYEKVMSIRIAYKALEESDLQEATLDAVAKDVTALMGREIDKQVKEILDEARDVDDARRNELEKELKDSLNSLANRIDRGYSIDVRAGEIPPAAEDSDVPPSDEEREMRAAAEQIQAKQERLKFANLSGQPILKLSESATATTTPTGRTDDTTNEPQT
jgi:hypothetical protein